jgi:hypothetical protein
MKQIDSLFTSALIAVVSVLSLPASAEAGFTLHENADESLDVLMDGRPVARYMHAHDTSSAGRHHETYKPYCHVYEGKGEGYITKGPGGRFTHHRGIFIGWNKMKFDGKTYDRWHMKGGDIVHQKFVEKVSGITAGGFTSLTHWNDSEGEAILTEKRTMMFRSAGKAGRLVVDFRSELTAVRGDVQLGGDPEHAGVQFRPANEVVTTETKYVFPRPGIDPKKDHDLPWVGETYTLAGARHSVVHMNHPSNPKGTRYSAYRDYGRFGAFFVKQIPADETLTVQYRFLIADGEMPDTAAVQSVWNEFAAVR